MDACWNAPLRHSEHRFLSRLFHYFLQAAQFHAGPVVLGSHGLFELRSAQSPFYVLPSGTPLEARDSASSGIRGWSIELQQARARRGLFCPHVQGAGLPSSVDVAAMLALSIVEPYNDQRFGLRLLSADYRR